MDSQHTNVSFSLAGLFFEYDLQKEESNIKKHGISFRTAARVFFDNDYIEGADNSHSDDEQRYIVIGDTSAGTVSNVTAIGNSVPYLGEANEILFVVYTERIKRSISGKTYEVIRLISARRANSFERGLYYGQFI